MTSGGSMITELPVTRKDIIRIRNQSVDTECRYRQIITGNEHINCIRAKTELRQRHSLQKTIKHQLTVPNPDRHRRMSSRITVNIL